MHFSINGFNLYEALNLCFAVSKSRVTLEALPNNQIKVSSTGTDLSDALSITLFAAVKHTGKFQINEAWLNFLRSSKKEDEVVVSTSKQRKKTKTPKTPGMGLYCEVSNGEAFFPVFAPSEEIGGLPFNSPTSDSIYFVSVSYLQKLLKLQSFTDPKTQDRDVIYLQPGVAYATSGTTAVSIPLAGDFDCGITPKSLLNTLKVFSKDEEVFISQEGSLLYFWTADKTYVCRTHKADLALPISKMLKMALSSDKDVTLPVKDFLKFLEPIRVACPVIQLTLACNLLTATGHGSDSLIELDFPCEYEGEEKTIYSTASVLVESLSAFEEVVELSFKDVKPFTMREGKLEAIAMPINVARTVAGVI